MKSGEKPTAPTSRSLAKQDKSAPELPFAQVRITGPDGAKIVGFGTPEGGKATEPPRRDLPARYNLTAGVSYRFKLWDIPNQPGVRLYPTITVAAPDEATLDFIKHQPLEICLTDADLDYAIGKSLLTLVVFQPRERSEDSPHVEFEVLKSNDIELEDEPVRLAEKCGKILLTLRLGSIDLESETDPPKEKKQQ